MNETMYVQFVLQQNSAMESLRLVLTIVPLPRTISIVCLALTLYMFLKDMIDAQRAQKDFLVHSAKTSAPELFMDVEELLNGWGYPLEKHRVRTEDGYVLTLHRIPRGRADNSSAGGASRPPVLLQHGMVSCSEQWMIGGPGVAPGLILADHGYDVWMPNTRGTNYSLHHESMGPDDPRFWNFTWHEMGVYDVPATVDYVLAHSEHTRLFFFGHSMGTLVSCVALSMRPQLNAKVRLQVGLGPAVFGIAHTTSAIAKVSLANQDIVKIIMTFLGNHMPTYEIFHRSDFLTTIIHMMCGDKSSFNKVCAMGYSLFMGSMDLHNTTGLSQILTRGFSSTSILVLQHYWQLVRTGVVRQYDLGSDANLRVYGAPEPPAYPLEKVTAPTALYGAEEDMLVTWKGVVKLSQELPNVVSTQLIKNKFFNHMSFVHQSNTYEMYMKKILKLMEDY